VNSDAEDDRSIDAMRGASAKEDGEPVVDVGGRRVMRYGS
jgi:hypothetical protein